MRSSYKAFVGTMFLSLLLASCFPGGDTTNGGSTSSVEVEQPGNDTEVLPDVSYQGRLEEAGVSLYMEGTHRLALGDSQYLLLESESVDLGQYLDEDVRVTGSVRDTVENGGRIMMVKSVALLYVKSSVSSSMSVESSMQASSEQSTVSSAAVQASSVVRSVQQSSVASAAAASSLSLEAQTSSSNRDAAIQARISTMAKSPVDDASWTQKYCTSHIGFCIPLHKSWWFKSFGATTSYLWHVEVSSEEIMNLGEGPVQINLLPGPVPDGITDGSVLASGFDVIGYRSWTNRRHFEITGAAELRSAVEYTTRNLTTYEGEQ